MVGEQTEQENKKGYSQDTRFKDSLREEATLIRLLDDLDAARKTVKANLAQYHSKNIVTKRNAPVDINNLNHILKRFLENNKNTDTIEKVIKLPAVQARDLLRKAHNHLISLSQSTNRAAQQTAKKDIKTLLDNLDSYNEMSVFETKDGRKSLTTHGFDVYMGYVRAIEAQDRLFEEIKTYTSGELISEDKMPQNQDALVIYSKRNAESHSSKLPQAGEKFVKGDAKYMALVRDGTFRKANDLMIGDKIECNRKTTAKLMEYKKCGLGMDKGAETPYDKQIDFTCEPLEIQYNTMRDNCMELYGATPIDGIYDEASARLEKVEMMSQADGSFVIDFSSIQEGLRMLNSAEYNILSDAADGRYIGDKKIQSREIQESLGKVNEQYTTFGSVFNYQPAIAASENESLSNDSAISGDSFVRVEGV